MGKYLVKATKTGFMFNLAASNSICIATSEIYSSEAACLGGVESVRACAPVAETEDQTVPDFTAVKHPKFEMYKDKAGEFRFRLKAKNGQIIAVSQGYTTKASCKAGISSVIDNADSPVVKEEQEEK